LQQVHSWRICSASHLHLLVRPHIDGAILKLASAAHPQLPLQHATCNIVLRQYSLCVCSSLLLVVTATTSYASTAHVETELL